MVHHVAPVWVITVVTLGVVAVGILIAYRMYVYEPVPDREPVIVRPLTEAARADLYGDAFNEKVLMRPGARLTQGLVTVDDKGLDGGVNRLADAIAWGSRGLRLTQTGFARSYALSMFAGAALVIVTILVVQLW